MARIDRLYLGNLRPKRGSTFPPDHLASAASNDNRLRLVQRCWTPLDVSHEVRILDASEFPGIVEIRDGKHSIGVLFQTLSGDAISVSGEADRVPPICKALASEWGCRFQKKARLQKIDFSLPETAMQIALAECDTKSIRKLLKAGLNPNGSYPTSPYGDDERWSDSFLSTAAELDEPEVCELLVEAGANPNEIHGDTKVIPVFHAAKKKAKRSFQYLLRVTERRFHAAARQALKNSSLTGPQVELISHLEWNVLGDSSGGVRQLKELRSQIQGLGKSSEVYGRLLQMACAYGEPKIVKYLLDEGAKTEVVDELGGTPLFQCCNHKACAMMLEAGAKPNAKNIENATPLMVIDWAKPLLLLLDYGAKANVKDVRGNGTILRATQSFFDREKRDPNQFAQYAKAEDKLFSQVLTRLVEGKANLDDSFDATGVTSLMMMAKLDFVASIETLLGAGADSSKADAKGKLAWQYAKRRSVTAKRLRDHSESVP